MAQSLAICTRTIYQVAVISAALAIELRCKLNLKAFEGDGSIPCLVLVDDSGKILSNSWVNGAWVGAFPVMQDTEKLLPVSSESP